MDKKQINQFDMLLRVNTYFDSNEAIWSSDVVISDVKTALLAKMDQIEAEAEKQLDDSTGETMNKTSLRKDLEAKALFISMGICAFTTLNPGHQELYQTVFITKTALFKMRETDLLYYTEVLHEVALEILGDLAPFKVDEATVAGLMAARTAFFDKLKRPREITTQRKEATEAISVLLHQAIALLKDTMDRLVGMLRESEPDFVNGYFHGRRIHHRGSRHLSLEISTVNAADNTPVAEAHIEVVGTKIKRISTKKGQNRVKNLKEGYYTLSVSHPDFAPQMIPFSVVSHVTTKLVVSLKSVLNIPIIPKPIIPILPSSAQGSEGSHQHEPL